MMVPILKVHLQHFPFKSGPIRNVKISLKLNEFLNKLSLFIAVDDIEEGKGADEELCLLPDEEREISDADKERAMQNQQQADENEDQENEPSEGNMEGIEENG